MHTEIKKYESIIDSSTDNFQKRHLILDEDIRHQLQMRCNALLGFNLLKCEKEYNMDHVFSKLVYKACEPYALDRLEQLADQGRFRKNDECGCGFIRKYSYKNTMIVACNSSETLLLHIKQGKQQGYLLFEIEKISKLDQHLQRNGDGKIYHYKS